MEYKQFGCRVNKYYLNSHIEDLKDHEGVLISTCEVTDRAKNKWKREVKRYLKLWNRVFITWCGVLKLWKLLSDEEFFAEHRDLFNYKNQITLLGESGWSKPKNLFTKKYIVVQNGCDTHCTFCLTIKKRWSSSSRPQEDIIEEINEFVSSGGKEIVLTWINLAAYGCINTRNPSTSQFTSLLRSILTSTEIERIRLSSLWPEFLDDAFFEIIKNSRIMPHFHISIQSFSDKVLKLMNRNYNKQFLSSVLSKFRDLNLDIPLSLGADLIVWFPGESTQDFEEIMQWVENFGINYLHVFPFSAHKSGETVPASLFENQIDPNMIIEREAKLRSLGINLQALFIKKNVWFKHKVLVEGHNKGYTPNFISVDTDQSAKRWEIIEMYLDSVEQKDDTSNILRVLKKDL